MPISLQIDAFGGAASVNPQEQRLKATAVMFLTVSLFLVRNAHAAPNTAGARTTSDTPRTLAGVERTG